MIDVLAGTKARRRILVAGEMLELGPSAEALHRECGVYAAEKKIDVVIGVRGLAKSLSDAAGEAGVEAHFMQTADQAGEWLAPELRAGAAVLLKASRGGRLGRAFGKRVGALGLRNVPPHTSASHRGA